MGIFFKCLENRVLCEYIVNLSTISIRNQKGSLIFPQLEIAMHQNWGLFPLKESLDFQGLYFLIWKEKSIRSTDKVENHIANFITSI